MLWLLIGCGEEILSEEPLSPPAEEPVVLGQEVQALWAPIEESHSKLSRIRFLAWDRNDNGTVDDNTELISVFDTDGAIAFSSGFGMLAHYFDSDRNGALEDEELSELSIWTDVVTPTLFNQLSKLDTPELEPLRALAIERIDLQDPEINGPLTWNKLCVIRTEEAPQSLWVPPNAGPIAEGCDLEVVSCHEPISIIEHIDNDGLAIDATEAEQLPDYPMSQPLESCFPGPSHYLDIEPNQPSAVTNPQDEHKNPGNEATEVQRAEEDNAPEQDEGQLEDTAPNAQADDGQNNPNEQDLSSTEPLQKTIESDTGLNAPPPSETNSDTLIRSVKRFAKTHQFGPSTSTLTVQTFKDGTALGASFSHNHIILARVWSGSIRWHPTDPNQCLIDFRVSVNGLDPDPPNLRIKFGLEGILDEADRNTIKENMLSEAQLNAEAHPNIIFQAYSCSGTKGIIEVTGVMTIRGVEREIRFPMNVSMDDGFKAKGFFSVLHKDFKLEPYSGLLGTIRNQEHLKFSFELNSLPE